MSKMTIAQRNGAGLCWKQPGKDIRAEDVPKAPVPWEPMLSGTPVSPTPLDIRVMPHKIPGLGQSPSQDPNFIHLKPEFPSFWKHPEANGHKCWHVMWRKKGIAQGTLAPITF